ncbi:MAG: tRNA epoxyqueuosine(34) reductase QueG [Bacteroidota bacterium]
MENAKNIGFSLCGFSKIDTLNDEKIVFQKWLKKGYNADMKFLERNIEIRANPSLLKPNIKTIISLAINYFPGNTDFSDSYQISKYALGEDYHDVLNEKLNELLQFIKKMYDGVEGFCFVDSAPIFEKAWAQRAGLGWIGKNSLLINKKYGSYLFLGEILLNIEIEPDTSSENYCGICDKCVKACPTGALEFYQLNSSKCISYLTIEHKGELPSELKNAFGNKIFGCDDCQTACPWNDNAVITDMHAFKPKETLLKLSIKDWNELDEEKFGGLFNKSALKRAKYSGFKRNIDFNS